MDAGDRIGVHRIRYRGALINARADAVVAIP
jgi:hypothetical protein